MALFSQDLHEFIRNTVRSVWALELLLVISKDPTCSWRVEDLDRELRSSLGLVANILAEFKRAGLVHEESDGRYRYQPATVARDHVVQELRTAYASWPFAVVRAITTAPNEKIQTFADAFKIKKDPDHQ